MERRVLIRRDAPKVLGPWLLVAGLIGLLVGCSDPGAPVSITSEEAQAKARTAIAAYRSALQSRLREAMAEGGPAGAIGVCKDAAPEIGKATSQAHRLAIGRTALRLRNPANAPDYWEREAMLAFQKDMAQGAEPGTLVQTLEVSKEGATALRYITPIPTGGLCLACHGSEIAPEVRDALARDYPEDQATGFQQGEMRGAFTLWVPVTD